MIVLDVSLNDHLLCRAGVGDDGTVSAIVGHSAVRSTDDHPAREHLDLHVGGMRLAPEEHLRWVNLLLSPGDTVVIEIAEASEATPPMSEGL